MLSELLTSNTRSEVMRLLFDGQEKEYYPREIEKLSSVSINSIQKELKHLSSLDLLKFRKDGNRIYYSANKTHPLYTDLTSIVEKTVGVSAQLRKRLEDDRVELAFLFGSFALGSEKSHSDIDLVVIGELGMRALSKLLSGLQEKVGREVNPHVFSKEEFSKRIKEEDHFVTSILQQRVKLIKGSLNEYQ